MAINATAVWRIRAGGAATNGGGYDPGIAGATTDYTDQDAAQASWTNLATTGITATVTSVSANFTSAMVGNCIRIASGTNFTAGYYFVVTFTNSTTIVLDRAPTTGVGVAGVGSLGGAFAIINQLANGGGGAQPSIATPLAAGHTVYIRGAGSSNPSSVDYTIDSYLQFPAGDTTSGLIKFIGYNGRPMLAVSYPILFYNINYWQISNIKIKGVSVTGSGQIIAFVGSGVGAVLNCIFDQNGYDIPAIVGAQEVRGCYFMNSGSTSAGTNYAVDLYNYNTLCFGNLFDNWRGTSIHAITCMGTIISNIISNCHSATAAVVIEGSQPSYHLGFIGNTVYNAAGDGVRLSSATVLLTATALMNNIIANCGGYGINVAAGTTALNNATFLSAPDYNNLFTNASGAYNNMSAGPHDVALDPQFTNAAGGDFSVGTNMKAIGFPSTFGP